MLLTGKDYNDDDDDNDDDDGGGGGCRCPINSERLWTTDNLLLRQSGMICLRQMCNAGCIVYAVLVHQWQFIFHCCTPSTESAIIKWLENCVFSCFFQKILKVVCSAGRA